MIRFGNPILFPRKFFVLFLKISKSSSCIDFDKKIRNNSRKKEVEVYVHRSCKPISEVDLEIEENQLNLFNDECTGYCGN